jgi:hypothetical protein
MPTAERYLRRSARCFRLSERPGDFSALERRGLVLMAHALWERAIELERRKRGAPASAAAACHGEETIRIKAEGAAVAAAWGHLSDLAS